MMIRPEWFWTGDWHAGKQEADRDIADGRTTVHETIDAMVHELDGPTGV